MSWPVTVADSAELEVSFRSSTSDLDKGQFCQTGEHKPGCSKLQREEKGKNQRQRMWKWFFISFLTKADQRNGK